MARPASTYRAARRNAARSGKAQVLKARKIAVCAEIEAMRARWHGLLDSFLAAEPSPFAA